MLNHPNVQNKIFDEINEHFGTDQSPTIQDRSKLTYLNAAILETQSLASLVPLAFPHTCSRDVTFMSVSSTDLPEQNVPNYVRMINETLLLHAFYNSTFGFFAEFDSPPKSNLRLEVNQLYIDGTNKVCHVWPDGCRLENLYIFLTCNCEETGRYSYAVAIRIPARWVNNMGYGVYVFDGDTKVKESCEFEIRDKLVRNCSNTREVYYYPFLRSKNGHQRSQVSPLALFVSVVSAGILQLKLSDLVLRRS
ncbi:hypothetical protein Btru_046884 [Bulinus truncatus]|nr:hypothetical protein Btru_046884 [Bulinus truncatus]